MLFQDPKKQYSLDFWLQNDTTILYVLDVFEHQWKKCDQMLSLEREPSWEGFGGSQNRYLFDLDSRPPLEIPNLRFFADCLWFGESFWRPDGTKVGHCFIGDFLSISMGGPGKLGTLSRDGDLVAAGAPIAPSSQLAIAGQQPVIDNYWPLTGNQQRKTAGRISKAVTAG